MRKKNLRILGGLLVSAALAVATVSATSAQTQPSTGPGGMMGGTGTTSGPGQMGQGGVMGGQGMMFGSGAQQGVPIGSVDAAKQAFQAYLDRTGNQDLALDEVMQFQWNYYAIVQETSTGSKAFELLADPQTGAVFPEIGPNMMWNTRYSPMAAYGGGMTDGMGGLTPGGMMSGTWGPTARVTQPTVTADQAKQMAQQWLDQYQAGSATEAPDTFPGYYTVHVMKDGATSGMLSVNAYTGQVWYHAWHGAFVSSAT